MEAHRALKEAGFTVDSFGTGSAVRLPGPSIDKPNVYPFGTPYDEIYKELEAQDPKLYTANGILAMLDRNRKIKTAPQKWHDGDIKFDVVFTCEERCFESVLDDMMTRAESGKSGKALHVINVDIKDDHENAVIGGQGILELANRFTELYEQCRAADALMSFDDAVMDVLTTWQEAHPHLPLLYSVCFE
ncbi:hypothetical protein BABINDRAFT_109840 [Babjeviella inositovora NRRL Y-12698]|uniref:RNA polymerase II subunit A C-terminal domain phosphatase SSU72 n=1 Tax=Babjeviella inositovora NRRL Y-12698 TaxID=984486 RepID=A0A1E3QVH0_9ASCO|nr:uncharacterized protein BABINDRAFT_109840 [Babjeviella inositovora NRRL Y-12698]ODQ81656.1 hypothetical protein BABINDRAFT_109840 [Babjeviella inositovora NRRL Y-12698]